MTQERGHTVTREHALGCDRQHGLYEPCSSSELNDPEKVRWLNSPGKWNPEDGMSESERQTWEADMKEESEQREREAADSMVLGPPTRNRPAPVLTCDQWREISDAFAELMRLIPEDDEATQVRMEIRQERIERLHSLLHPGAKRVFKNGWEQNEILHIEKEIEGEIDQDQAVTLKPGEFEVLDFLYGYPDRPGEAWYSLYSHDSDEGLVVTTLALDH